MRLMFLLIMLFPLMADELLTHSDTTQVEADDALYRDGVLHLSSHVAIYHPFGLIRCEKAQMHPNRNQESFKQTPLTKAYAQENVEISLNGRGTLNCEHAYFNLDQKQGQFRNQPGEGPVIYQGFGPLPASEPITLMAQEMRIQVDGEIGQGMQLKQLEAEGEVHLIYRGEAHVYAGLARYEVIDDVQTVELFPKAKQPCEIVDGSGNRVRANRIHILPDQQQVRFDRPEGDLYVMEDESPSHRIRFSSQHMTWSIPEHKLSLVGMVRVQQPEVGEMESNDRLVIEYEREKRENQLAHVRSYGHTRLTYYDELGGNPHKIDCFGLAHIDNKRQQVSLTTDQQQVRYTDRMGVVTADEVLLSYSKIDDRIDLNRLTLQGGVTMENTAPFEPEQTTPVHQYAVADLVEYHPELQRMDLLAEGSARVLYYDRINQVQLSAPGIRLQRDATTQKEFVQGLGDVRFTLMKPELDELNTHFGLQQTPNLEAIR